MLSFLHKRMLNLKGEIQNEKNSIKMTKTGLSQVLGFLGWIMAREFIQNMTEWTTTECVMDSV